jgi:predicted enzyme related to lactoylglutathione lyase
MGGTMYTSFMNGERPAAGMLQITEEMGEIPPNWLVYFCVADCDQTADKAKKLGANVVVPPVDIPEVGRFAVVMDPQGAGFAIIQLLKPA